MAKLYLYEWNVNKPSTVQNVSQCQITSDKRNIIRGPIFDTRDTQTQKVLHYWYAAAFAWIFYNLSFLTRDKHVKSYSMHHPVKRKFLIYLSLTASDSWVRAVLIIITTPSCQFCIEIKMVWIFFFFYHRTDFHDKHGRFKDKPFGESHIANRHKQVNKESDFDRRLWKGESTHFQYCVFLFVFLVFLTYHGNHRALLPIEESIEWFKKCFTAL